MSSRQVAVILAILLPTQALASLERGIPVQVKARQVSSEGSFWSGFVSLFSGKLARESADLSVKITDSSGRGLEGVSVMVGQKKGDPFASNVRLTGADGLALFKDEKLRPGSAWTITASKSGYSTLSLVNNDKNTVDLVLPKLSDEQDFGFLSGKVTGFPPGYGKNVLELGLFLPAFRPESLANFDPEQFVSNYQVEIDLFGKREVPGNLVLPPQKKRWGLVPISLSKPEFIMPLALGTKSLMSTTIGAVGVSDAVSAIREKDFLTILNLTQLTHIGWTTKRVEVRGNERFDLAAAHALTPRASTAKFKGVEPKLDVVAVSLFDALGDEQDFVTMDVKSLKSEEVKNGTGQIKVGLLKDRRTKDNFYIFTGLFDRTQIADRASNSRSIIGALEKVSGRAEPVANFNGFLRPIKFEGTAGDNREYRFSSPANPQQGLSPTFILVNIVSEKRNELTHGRTRNVLWSAVIPGNSDRLSLPNLGKPVLPEPDATKKERFIWEVIAVKAREAAHSTDLDIQSALRNLQHVSSLSQKF